MNNHWLKKKTSISCQIHTQRIVNKARYNDPAKPMKQTNFIVKNLGETFSKNNPV